MADGAAEARYETVKVEREAGIAWVTLNRPEKRNAMNPTMHFEMVDVLAELEADPEVRVLVLTGAGPAWCAGQDIKEFIRDLSDKPVERRRAQWATHEWRWRRLFMFPKPTIAMVNGFCLGGAFTQLVACDFAVAAEDATFGLSEVNWGSFPGGMVSRALAEVMNLREAMYYILTGASFDGRKAAELHLVTLAVPADELRAETVKLANTLMEKSPAVLQTAKEAYKTAKSMHFWQAEEYFGAKMAALQATDPAHSQAEGIRQFIDEKTFRPGFESMPR